MHRNKKKILLGSFALLAALGLGIATGFGIWGSAKNSVLERNGGIKPVTFFSNQDFYLDKGFNEGTYYGVANFGKKTNQSIGIQLATKGYSNTGKEYIDDIKTIYQNGAEIIISSGFNVAGIVGYLDWDNGGKFTVTEGGLGEEFNDGDLSDKSFYLLDDNDLFSAGFNENSGSIIFKSEEAGFFAGLMAALDSTAHYKENGKENVVTAWGGIQASTSTFLSGYEQGINYFNYQVLGYDPYGESTGSSIISDADPVKLSWNGSDFVQYSKDESASEELAGSIGDASPTPSEGWYTGGFDYPTGPSAESAIAKTELMKKTSNVIFPVAGGQTLLAIDGVTGTSTQVIGVDTSAGAANPDKKDNILGSATKNLDTASEYAAWYEETFKPAYELSKERGDVTNDLDSLTKDDVYLVMNSIKSSDPYSKIKDGMAVQFAMSSNDNSDSNFNGWNVTTEKESGINSIPENTDNHGQIFLGTYENGGVGFTLNGNSNITNDVTELFAGTSLDGYNFYQLADLAYQAQEGDIEERSATFSNFGSTLSNHDKPWLLPETWVR